MTKDFDPNAAALENSGIFGLPFTVDEAKLILVPVPWEATTSYGGGTSLGPKAILKASKQVDLFDFELGNFFEAGIAMSPISEEIQAWNHQARAAAEFVIDHQNNLDDPNVLTALETVNSYSLKINEYVYHQVKELLTAGKNVGLVGGDHSIPFGAIQAFLEKYPNMGILHFDAHADMRRAYEGFEHSHASIMYNVITRTSLKKLIQVGIRDFCEEEFDFIKKNSHRIKTFFDVILNDKKMNGMSWSAICDEIVESLPNEVYISFDIDGLDPRFCPHTGTPVPGGLDFFESLFLIKKVKLSGRKIIGFDLNEVSPGTKEYSDETDTAAEWDANVGARLLYKLCGWLLHNK